MEIVSIVIFTITICIITIKIFFVPIKSLECIFCESETGEKKGKELFLSTTKIIPVCKNHKLDKKVLKICDNISDINYQYYKKYLDFIFDQRLKAQNIDLEYMNFLKKLELVEKEFQIKNLVKEEITKEGF